MRLRTLEEVVPSLPASDGAGVKLRRSLGARPMLRHDPFLMLDEFFSDDPGDYLAGFPPHPHRGFETVTYMLDGRMRHQDHLGNTGDLGPGDVQWMTAGRGIVHSEMPQQSAGRLRGFQLWLNLPAREKMQPPRYRDVPAREIPTVALASGARVRVIAGRFAADGATTAGPINATAGASATDPLYLDVELPAGADATIPIARGHNAFVYVYEHGASVAGAAATQPIPYRAAGLLSDGDLLRLVGGPSGARVLVLAGQPLGEPVVQYGPFVMNTREEIEQAIADYQNGVLATR
jgi:hypothetical protein